MKAKGVPVRYRLDVMARLTAALAGGYGIATLVAIACARALPIARIDAVAVGTIAALVAMPVAIMGCFWARSVRRAWAGVAIFAMIFAAIALAAGWRP